MENDGVIYKFKSNKIFSWKLKSLIPLDQTFDQNNGVHEK